MMILREQILFKGCDSVLTLETEVNYINIKNELKYMHPDFTHVSCKLTQTVFPTWKYYMYYIT